MSASTSRLAGASALPQPATGQWLFFLLCACLPWLSPVAGGAMTPAIPLLLGWMCIALLFVAFPAYRGAAWVVYAGLFVAVAALGSVLFNTQWQLFALGLLMIGCAAAVGAHCAQQPAVPGGADSHAGIRLIAWSWLLAGLLNAGIGLLQAWQATGWLGLLVNHAPPGQVYGNLRQRNQFASLMMMALWALWYLWYSGGLLRLQQAAQTRMRGGWLAWLLMLPLAVALALTMSRTGFVQLAALVLMLLWWDWRRPPAARAGWPLLAWLAALVVVYVLASWVLPGMLQGDANILERLEGSDTRACVSRVTLWQNVWALTLQQPWTGWGWGELAIAHYQADYPGLRFCLMLDNAHNLPLHLAFTFGLPLVLLLAALIVWWLGRNRPWHEQAPQRQLMWGVLLVIGIHSMLEYPLWYAHFQLAFGLALGVLWALPPQTGQTAAVRVQPATPVPQKTWLLGQRCIAALTLLGLLYASFDFVRVTQLYTAPEERVWPFKHNTQQQAECTILYQNAVGFAELTTVPLTAANAAQQLALAQRLMHYSPEARVVQRTISALRLLGRQHEADQAEAHFQSVYPQDYQRWKQDQDEDASGES